MVSKPQDLWFSDGEGECPYNGPSFYEVKDFPQLKELEENWKVVRDEIVEYLKRTEIPAYLDKSLIKGKNSWKTQSIVFWDFVNADVCKKCPKTWGMLKKISNLSTASINILEANTDIKPHIGDTNAVIRGHLPLIVPSNDPAACGFRVMTETRPWTEGKFLLFPDSQRHAAWNRTQHPRLVLLIDLFKEEYSPQMRSYVCCRVLGKIYADVLRGKWRLWDRVFGARRGRLLLRTLCQRAFAVGYRVRKRARLKA